MATGSATQTDVVPCASHIFTFSAISRLVSSGEITSTARSGTPRKEFAPSRSSAHDPSEQSWHRELELDRDSFQQENPFSAASTTPRSWASTKIPEEHSDSRRNLAVAKTRGTHHDQFSINEFASADIAHFEQLIGGDCVLVRQQ